MSVRQQHGVYVAEPRIVDSHRGLADIIKETHAARILEDHGAIAFAQFAGVRTQRCDLYVLRPGRRGGGTRQHQRCRKRGLKE